MLRKALDLSLGHRAQQGTFKTLLGVQETPRTDGASHERRRSLSAADEISEGAPAHCSTFCAWITDPSLTIPLNATDPLPRRQTRYDDGRGVRRRDCRRPPVSRAISACLSATAADSRRPFRPVTCRSRRCRPSSARRASGSSTSFGYVPALIQLVIFVLIFRLAFPGSRF
jgi:hypothetical protein